MADLDYSDDYLRWILRENRKIAGVGMSTNPIRPSFFVGNYLGNHGFDVIAVNPVSAGESLFGHQIVGSFAEIPDEFGPVHMVDIFRRSEHVVPIVKEAIDVLLDRGLKTIWMQIGVVNHEAAAMAEEAGLDVIMDLCPKQEFQRLRGELSWGGFNSGIISSKRPKS